MRECERLGVQMRNIKTTIFNVYLKENDLYSMFIIVFNIEHFPSIISHANPDVLMSVYEVCRCVVFTHV